MLFHHAIEDYMSTFFQVDIQEINLSNRHWKMLRGRELYSHFTDWLNSSKYNEDSLTQI